MRADTDTLRQEIAASLHALDTAACLQLIRFRKHTARSAAGHALDVVVDELSGSDSDFVDNRSAGRPGEPGLVVVAYTDAGEVLRHEVHPVRTDFEPQLLSLVVKTCRRLNCALEAWIEHDRRARWEPGFGAASPGYRAAISLPRDEASAAGLELLERGLRRTNEQPPRVWLAAILALLCVAALPFTILAMLFREPREVLVGMFRNSLNGYRHVWEATLSGQQLLVRTPEQQHSVPLHDILWVTSWPRGWSTSATGNVFRIITPHETHDLGWAREVDVSARYIDALRLQST